MQNFSKSLFATAFNLDTLRIIRLERNRTHNLLPEKVKALNTQGNIVNYGRLVPFFDQTCRDITIYRATDSTGGRH